jgi:hypothetical protein
LGREIIGEAERRIKGRKRRKGKAKIDKEEDVPKLQIQTERAEASRISKNTKQQTAGEEMAARRSKQTENMRRRCASLTPSLLSFR